MKLSLTKYTNIIVTIIITIIIITIIIKQLQLS